MNWMEVKKGGREGGDRSNSDNNNLDFAARFLAVTNYLKLSDFRILKR